MKEKNLLFLYKAIIWVSAVLLGTGICFFSDWISGRGFEKQPELGCQVVNRLYGWDHCQLVGVKKYLVTWRGCGTGEGYQYQIQAENLHHEPIHALVCCGKFTQCIVRFDE